MRHLPPARFGCRRQVLKPARRNRLLSAFGVWCFRGLLLIPFGFMAPEIISLVLGRPGSVANVSASTADVLGTSSFLLFVMMLSVTPIHTMTGWRWHLILRRDYGVAMFFTAGTDLTLAALTTGDTFPGGPLRASPATPSWCSERCRSSC